MRRSLFPILLFLVSSAFGQAHFVTTIRPFELILREVVAPGDTVTAILPPGASPHSYELRPSDARRLAAATALVYGASNLDAWVLAFDHPRTVTLLDMVPASLQRHFGDGNGDPGHDRHDHGHDHGGVDPHFWTDPLAVRALLPALAAALGDIHPPAAPTYRANADAFAMRLDSLTRALDAELAPLRSHTMVFSHPFFHYFLGRFGLSEVLDIELNPGREPTPRQVAGLLRAARERNAAVVFSLPQYPDRPARLLADSAGIPFVLLDPLGGAGQESYAALLHDNARRMREALP